jgi:hypothetical protein
MSIKRRYGRHGMSYSSEYKSWNNMISRCYYPNYRSYHRYGGRGIKVCERWRYFTNFYEDMGNKPTRSHSIDRINNNGNYEPSNCRWSSKKEQSNNRENSHYLVYNGKKLTVSQWAVELNIDRNTLWARMRYGWPIHRILSEPVNK